METYIALLLMIVPGFLSKIVYEKLNCEKRYISDLSDVITSLIFSIFILLLDYIFFGVAGVVGGQSMPSLISLFNSNNFIISYILITFFNSIYIAFVWDSVNIYCLKILNKVRIAMGKNKTTTSRTIFESLSDGEAHLLKVAMSNRTIYGAVDSIYKDNGNDSGFSLCKCSSAENIIRESDERISKLGEEKSKIYKIEYILPETDTQITEYITENRKASKIKRIDNPPIKIFFLETGIFLLSIFVVGFLVKYVFKLI